MGWIPKLLTGFSSGSATSGYVPKADGSGGISWAAESGGGGGGGGGALAYLGEYAMSAASSVDIDLPSGYAGILIKAAVTAMSGSWAVTLNLQMGAGSIDTGSNYDYARTTYGDASSGSTGDAGTAIVAGFGGSADELIAFDVRVLAGYDDSGLPTDVHVDYWNVQAAAQYGRLHSGRYMTDAAVDLLRIAPSTGTITGTIHVYGYGTSSVFSIIGDGTELTIASDAVTITGGFHTVDTESDASADDLATVNGGTAGQLLVLKAADDARTVTLKDGTGNLRLAGDFDLDHTDDTITLIYDGSNWCEVSRSGNAA